MKLQHLLLSLCGMAEAVLMSRAPSVPISIQQIGEADDSTPITLHIGLRLSNIDRLEGLLRGVSEPLSTKYGRYYDEDQIITIFKPSETAVKATVNWLKTAGITDVQIDPFNIHFATTVGEANRLLNASYAVYSVQGFQKIRTMEYHIPDILSNHIELVHPTNYFGYAEVGGRNPAVTVARRKTRREDDENNTEDDDDDGDDDDKNDEMQNLADCAAYITPKCLQAMYNIQGYRAGNDTESRIAFASFLNQSAVPPDLQQYAEIHSLLAPRLESVTINDGMDHQNPDKNVLEANLDVQLLAAIVQDMPITQYVTGGSPPIEANLRMDEDNNTNEPYLPFYEHLLALSRDELPHVISISYADEEQTVPREYAIRTCNMMSMMGLRGVSILESSGDSGVGATCRANDGSERVEFTPLFPPTCPYVTAVGGTQSWHPESAWVGSGGGFSNYFSQAWYQTFAVQDYLQESLSLNERLYLSQYNNLRGRALPDISAHSQNPPIQVIVGGDSTSSGGTSASAPIVAGMIALLNDARLRAGLPVMGFLNPWIYSGGYKAFRDITTGGSSGCNTVDLQTGEVIPGGGYIPYANFNATEGWDPVTGWGVPDFQAMRKLAVGQCS